MEIQFYIYPLPEIDLLDDLEYNKFSRQKVPQSRYHIIGSCLLIFLLNAIISGNFFYILCILAITIVISFLLIMVERTRLKKAAANPPRILGECIVTITLEGIREKTTIYDSATDDRVHSWLAVTDILEYQDYIFFFITETFPYEIPKRAFANPEAAKTFVDTALEYWEIANSKKL